MGHNRHVLSTTSSTRKPGPAAPTAPGPLEVQWNPRDQSPHGHPGGGSCSSDSSCPHSLCPASQRPLRWRTTGVRRRAAEEYEYIFAATCTFDDEPLEGVEHHGRGHGYEADDRDRRRRPWRSACPRRRRTRSRSTRTPSPRASSSRRARPRVTRRVRPRRRTKSVNFFLGEGQRSRPSFFDQLLQRLDQRPELRPAARPRGDRPLADLRHHRASRTSPTPR